MSYDHEDTANHWKEYTWTVLEFDGGIIKYDPPTDPTFYILSSHDNAPDDDLTQSIELIASVLEDYREWFTGEADDLDIKEWTPQVNRLTLVSRHMEEILAQRWRDCDAKDEARKVCEDDNGSKPQPQSTPSPSHNSEFEHNTITTSPPDIIAPNPFPPSPNISVRQPESHLYHHPPPQPHPPNIVEPPPLPLKPNIPCQHLFWMFEDEHHLEEGRCVLRPRLFPFLTFLLSLSVSVCLYLIFVSLSFRIFRYPSSFQWTNPFDAVFSFPTLLPFALDTRFFFSFF
jgi:hypothetical protein